MQYLLTSRKLQARGKIPIRMSTIKFRKLKRALFYYSPFTKKPILKKSLRSTLKSQTRMVILRNYKIISDFRRFFEFLGQVAY
jgi:hypothetical protein